MGTTGIHPHVDPKRPLDASARIRGLDALRGVALLGILLANVRQMFMPWSIGNFAVSLGGSDHLVWLDWQFFHALVDLKFLTLFSVLFGIGFALQDERLSARGDGFVGIYLRRVAILALLGIVHALLLYPAEVLLPYAVTGLLLLGAHKLSADNLLRTGLVLLGIATLWGYQLGALGSVDIGVTLLSIALLAGSVILLWRRNRLLALGVWAVVLFAAGCALTLKFNAGDAAAGIASEYREAQQQLAAMSADDMAAWPEEFRVRRAGDFAALVRLHASQYADILFYFAVVLLWRTLSLFMIGAGLFRSGVLTQTSSAAWKRVAIIGLGIGLPLSILATGLHGREIHGFADWRFPTFLHAFSALPLAAGIAGAVFVLHRRDAQRWLWMRIEAAGRMALTNYLGQSLVMAALAESWGFGLYGHFGGPALTALAVVVFAVLALFSHLWLTRFRMGPLEWLWRCGTYWRWLPNRTSPMVPDLPGRQ